MAVFDFAAFSEERIGLIEKKNCAAVFSRVKEAAHMYLCLSDVCTHDRREINTVKIQAELVGNHFGGHRLARAAVAGKQRADAETTTHSATESPLVIDLGTLP